MVKLSAEVEVIEVFLRCLLRDRRKALGLSQQDVENLTGISRHSLSLYENDKSDMEIETAAKLAIALNCTINDLFEYKRI